MNLKTAMNSSLGSPTLGQDNLEGEVRNARYSLHTAVDARKVAERDAQLLLNRINLLKNEEEKTRRMLAMKEAKERKLMEVRNSKLNLEFSYQYEHHKGDSYASVQDKTQYLREMLKANRESARCELAQEKARIANNTRRSIQQKVEERLEQELAERERVFHRTEAIKQERKDAKRRIEEERVARLQSVRRDYQARLIREEKKRLRAEEQIARLEKEEMELIGRLQKSHEEQTRTKEDFRSLKTAPVTPMQERNKRSPFPHSTGSITRKSPVVASVSKWEVGGPALR
jgi:hypothetical protein